MYSLDAKVISDTILEYALFITSIMSITCWFSPTFSGDFERDGQPGMRERHRGLRGARLLAHGSALAAQVSPTSHGDSLPAVVQHQAPQGGPPER